MPIVLLVSRYWQQNQKLEFILSYIVNSRPACVTTGNSVSGNQTGRREGGREEGAGRKKGGEGGKDGEREGKEMTFFTASHTIS